jgi:F-type H+-transporting ATPase subunit delta
MKDKTLANRYASALLSAGLKSESLETVAQEAAWAYELILENPSFCRVLENPRISDEEKQELVRNVFSAWVSSLFLVFVFVLLRRNRIEYLVDILEEFKHLVDTQRGIQRVRVISAFQLSSDLVSGLKEKLAALTEKNVQIELSVSADILGGIIVKIDNTIIDGSIRRRLVELRQQLLAVRVH